MATGNRIPSDLQAVFIASNQGHEVLEPPASKSAFKVFRHIVNGGLRKFRKLSSFSDSQRPVGGAMNRFRRLHSFTEASSTSFPAYASSNSFQPPEQKVYHEAAHLSPQQWVEDYLENLGYSTKRHNTVMTGYYTDPTEFQLASYNTRTVELCTKVQHENALRDMLNCGISLNACNKHGESLMHKACRLGLHQILRVFLEFGPDLKICDAQGRTLLHDTCWGARPSFQTFTLLIEHEPDLLFMADCRGACPLDYVQQSHYDFWIEYLECHAGRFWPVLEGNQKMPALVDQSRNSRTIPTPSNALSPQLASMVASGRLKPHEAILLAGDDESSGSNNKSCNSDEEDEDFGEDDSSSSCSSFDSLQDQIDQDLLDDMHRSFGGLIGTRIET